MILKDKVAVVTGGTGGLGWEICRAFGREGMKVVLVYQASHEKAKNYVATLEADGVAAAAVCADVTTAEGITAMEQGAEAAFGPIDVLVLNAAFNVSISFTDLETLTPETWNHIIGYNLTAPFLAMRQIGPKMKQRGCGRIITISSVAGFYPMGSSIAYATSKAGLVHLTRCMAVSLAPEVLVNGVAPGLMEGTRMTANLTAEFAQRSRDTALLKRAAHKEDVADAVVTFARTDSITGQNLVVDSGKLFR